MYSILPVQHQACCVLCTGMFIDYDAQLWQVGIDSWINRNEVLHEKTEEERLEKTAKAVDDQIRTRYEHDQGNVREEDKSFFLRPVEVGIRRHNIYQKRKWVESVVLAVNAWLRTHAAGFFDGVWLRPAPIWKMNQGRRPWVRKQKKM